MELIGDIKTYDWGKIGEESEVSKLAKLNSQSFHILKSTPYSELWMGDHVSGPAKLKKTGETLRSFLQNYSKDLIGGHSELPFLLKVLSVRKALSIQIHPNKIEAEQLHSERPEIYKDPNHKPELAIALTPFTALCGFRPYDEILSFLQRIQPLTELIGRNNVECLKEGILGLKACFSTLMTSPENKISTCIKDISEEYNKVLGEYKLYDIFTTVNRDFPNDVGVLCLFFFNLIQLNPGEAIFLPANEPHAYLKGDCVECMACSDNVIRAGLTPKYKDVNTLLRMINYSAGTVEAKLFKPQQLDEFVQHFIPKIEDFAVAKFNIPASKNNYKWKNIKYGSIILVLEGQRILKTETLEDLKVSPGSIAFIPGNCGEYVDFLKVDDDESNFIAYLASYNCF